MYSRTCVKQYVVWGPGFVKFVRVRRLSSIVLVVSLVPLMRLAPLSTCVFGKMCELAGPPCGCAIVRFTY